MSHIKILTKYNSCSEDFPFRTKFGNVIKNDIAPVLHRRISPICYEYNNETPDMFKLDIMKKGSLKYNNPYLDEVVGVDRSESLKNIEKSGKIIKMLDEIKGNFKVNRDEDFLNRIKSEKEMERINLYKSKSTTNMFKKNIDLNNNRLKLTYDTNYNQYKKTLFKLYESHRNRNDVLLNHKLSKEVDPKSLTYIAEDIKMKCSILDKEKLENLKSKINNKQSSYLTNMNTFDIKESYNENKRCKFEFIRKPYIIYNPITNVYSRVKPDNILKDKWDSYEESYYLLSGKLGIKKGYFNEFNEMNKCTIKLLNEKEKLKRDKEKEKENIIPCLKKLKKKIKKNF